MKKLLIVFAVAVMTGMMTGCEKIEELDFTSSKVVSASPSSEPMLTPMPVDVALYGAYEVVRVSDGDTIVVDINGTDTKIRLIGIDTPESVHPDKDKNTKEGKVASDWVKELLQDKSVYLEYDVDIQDHYNRTLAYVYLDEQTMLQEELLKNGLATVYTVQPNSKYSDEFFKIQKTARENNIGFWETKFFNEERGT